MHLSQQHTASFLQWKILLITFSSPYFASGMRPVSGNKGISFSEEMSVWAACYDVVFVSEI